MVPPHSQEAPQVTFTIMSLDRFAFERLERGQVDVVITLEKYLLPQHPHMFLLEDDFAVICWSESSYRNGIDAKQFLAARHAVACFGIDALPAFSESYFSEQGIERRGRCDRSQFFRSPLCLDRNGAYRDHAPHACGIFRAFHAYFHSVASLSDTEIHGTGAMACNEK